MPRLRFRRALPHRWRLINPVLAEGEPGYEIGTGGVKVGDGTTPWNDLAYLAAGEADALGLSAHINNPTPHPVYDDGASLVLLYENAKV